MSKPFGKMENNRLIIIIILIIIRVILTLVIIIIIIIVKYYNSYSNTFCITCNNTIQESKYFVDTCNIRKFYLSS